MPLLKLYASQFLYPVNCYMNTSQERNLVMKKTRNASTPCFILMAGLFYFVMCVLELSLTHIKPQRLSIRDTERMSEDSINDENWIHLILPRFTLSKKGVWVHFEIGTNLMPVRLSAIFDCFPRRIYDQAVYFSTLAYFRLLGGR